jgi:hypothetical protein
LIKHSTALQEPSALSSCGSLTPTWPPCFRGPYLTTDYQLDGDQLIAQNISQIIRSGRVKFSRACINKFGFIVPDDAGSDVFVHANTLAKPASMILRPASVYVSSLRATGRAIGQG